MRIFSITTAVLALHSFQVLAFSNVNTNNVCNEVTSPSSSKLAATTQLEYEVNSEELFATSTFPIKPNDLIQRAKEVLSDEISLGTKDNGECLSDNFVFRAQFVEIDKVGYLNALKTFNLQESFDIQPNYFGFVVDPMQTNRVWFYGRSVATHTGTFQGVEPTNKVLTLPPQSFHLDFEEDGQLKEVGFYTVDRAQGNTGGLGGAFAYFYGVGKPLPFPEARPYKPSFKYRMIQKLGRFLERFQKKKDD